MLLLDTRFLIEYEAEIAADKIGPARALLRANPSEPVAVCVICLGEFAEGSTDPSEVEAALSRFTVVQLSRQIACKTAAMQSSLPQRLGENDAWIAATALAHNAVLAGREKAFRRVPRLKYKEI